MRTKILSQKWEKINKKFVWLKVALVNIFRVASVFFPRVIYENVDIVFIGIYNKHLSYPLSILKEIFMKSN
jgi:hypothetical protein